MLIVRCSYLSRRAVLLGVLATGFLALGLSMPVQAQRFGRLDDLNTNVTTYYHFAQPGEATIQVFVLGAGLPGLYEIGEGTDLGSLFILAGGSGLDRQQAGVRRRVTIRLFKENMPQRTLAYEASLADLLATPGTYPSLEDRDILQVEIIEKRRFSWRDGLVILTSLGTLALIVENILR